MAAIGDKESALRATPAPSEEVVQTIVARMEARLGPISQRLVERYQEDITDYRLADEALLRDVHEVTLGALRVVVANLAAGRRPGLDELEVTRAGAARRVHQHVSLESFLHAVRLLGRALYETLLDCTDHDVVAERDAAFSLAGQILEHLDLQSIAAAQGYMTELHSVWSDQEVLRRDLLDALLAGDGDSESVRRVARSLRLRLGTDYFVVVVRTGERIVEDAADPIPASRRTLRRLMEATRQHLRPSSGALLMGMRHGELVALYPYESTAESQHVRDGCERLVTCLDELPLVAVGVSGPGKGIGTLPASYGEAREALEIAAAKDASAGVVAFDEVLIESLVRGVHHAERIISATVGRLLEYDQARHAELVPTLEAFLACGFNVARSAEALCVHPNTVVYRLGRIKSLSGRDPHIPDDLLLLQVGLKLARLGS